MPLPRPRHIPNWSVTYPLFSHTLVALQSRVPHKGLQSKSVCSVNFTYPFPVSMFIKRKQKQENKLLPFTLNISNPHHFSVDDVTSYFHEITEPISTKYLILAPHPQNPRKVCDQSPFSLENAGRNINLIVILLLKNIYRFPAIFRVTYRILIQEGKVFQIIEITYCFASSSYTISILRLLLLSKQVTLHYYTYLINFVCNVLTVCCKLANVSLTI